MALDRNPFESKFLSRLEYANRPRSKPLVLKPRDE